MLTYYRTSADLSAFCRYDDFGLPLRKNKTDFEVPVSPDSEALVMNSRSSRNGLKELLANRKKNMKGKSDWFLDALVESDSFDVPVNVSVVDIVAANPLESFHGIFVVLHYGIILS